MEAQRQLMGYFYDVMKYGFARAAFGGETWMSHVYRLDETDLPKLSLAESGSVRSADYLDQ